MASKSKSSPVSAPAPKDPRAVRSHSALVSALLKLLEQRPFDQITIRDLVAEAGIGYTTFFRHHATKEELLDAIAAEQIRCLFNLVLPAQDAYDLHAGSTALFTYVNAHRPLWSTLLTGGAAETVRAEFQRKARDFAVAWRSPDEWVPAELGSALIVGGTLDLLAWWLRQSQPLPIKRIVEIHERLVSSPVIAANAPGSKRKRKG
jgi:AcrR family transcriptional regulator